MIQIPFKQFISAGHNNADSGAVAHGNKEADVTKLIRDSIARNSRSSEIILDKDWENNRQYQSRIKPGNGSVVFDIHLNAAAKNTTSGIEAFINKKDFANSNSLSWKMANRFLKEYSTILGIPNRGVKGENSSQHSRIGILNLGAGISVLLEVDFITSTTAVGNIISKKDQLGKVGAKILQDFDDMIK
ncbi:N-acetylmuramoyl-L-alanine amidase [Chryseobacterium sp. MP_3.2]|uniref:N-acetylmuramoyl-L-alanine amidase n=1 Tax=Chryseobacterium sp. MP_3.2 TaxID=3071712 RepID=UPI002DFB4D48|nr:N-acetylmuramoyl-L-alanine amidase [Chryseobacterium sp. MP_3.2]MEC5157064.1 N-acetylmuramoyl-L-alanine amidase [Chryseobacterium sp. MP_3.2]